MMDQPPRIGRLESGARDAITDVAGVTVGHATLADGAVQTGVTVIHPHARDPFLHKAPAAAAVTRMAVGPGAPPSHCHTPKVKALT